MRTFSRTRIFRSLLIVFGICATCTIACGDEYGPEVAERIAAVESGLLPAVRVKGRTLPHTIAERMNLDNVPAVSVAVINNYQVEWAKAYGVVEAGQEKPASSETLFQAASMSKPVTALAALKLVQQGELDLDTDVNKTLKSWHLPENDFTREHAVDLRGLLSHTAGLTVHGFPGYKVGEPLPTVPQILDGVAPANTAAVRVDKLPGRGFRYSGGGTTMAQLVMTDVTGRPFTDLMQEIVLTPLGMSHSTFAQPLPEDRQPQAATAHNDRGQAVEGHWHVYPEQAPAGLWTTPADMCRYVIEVQRAHEGKSAQVIDRAMTDKMLTPQGGGPVGLGPFLVERGGAKLFEHSGGNEGFRCQFIGYLDRGQGAVVMTNSDAGNRAVNETMNAIALAYDWPGFVPPERESVQLDNDAIDRLVGDYALSVASLASIKRRDDRLFIKLPRQAEIELYPLSGGKFFTTEPEVSGRSVTDEAGHVTAVVFNFGERELNARRVPN